MADDRVVGEWRWDRWRGTNSGGEDRAEVFQWFAADEADEGNTLCVEVAPLGAEFLIALATPV
ncbi:hypothetical protein [Streptomyces sp. NPDC002526]